MDRCIESLMGHVSHGRVALAWTSSFLLPPLLLRSSSAPPRLSTAEQTGRPQRVSAVVAGGRCRDGLELGKGSAVFTDFWASNLEALPSLPFIF